MFENFVLKSKKNKVDEYLAAIKREFPDFPEQDFRDYMWLAEQSINHKDDPFHIIVRDVVWVMLNKTYVIEREGDKPVGYLSWGFFSEKVSKEKLELHKANVTREDYNSGNVIWLLDVIAPFGHAKKMIAKIMLRKKAEGYSDHEKIHFRRWYKNRNLERASVIVC